MLRYLSIGLALWMGMLGSSIARGEQPPAGSKARVELRWVETKQVADLTEAEGFQSSCDPDSIVYPRRKPALVLTAVEVAEARLTNHDFSKSGLSRANYSVDLTLTKEARTKLAAACEGNQMRLLTVVLDGHYWGLYRYEKDAKAPFVPEAARAESFAPSVGYFSNMADAQRLVDAVK